MLKRKRIPLRALGALVQHEGRRLAGNRVACLLLGLMCVAAMPAGRYESAGGSSSGEACYVVYWEESDWTRRLEAAAGRAAEERGLEIQLVRVSDLVDEQGVIRYPSKTHSIQLRPLAKSNAGEGGWRIWYWYAGSDPAAVLPYALWFQEVTHEFFENGPGWQERVSPLRPEWTVHPRLKLTGTILPGDLDSEALARRAPVGLVWMALFFTAGYLFSVGLAESLYSGAIYSLVVTPVGWSGAAGGSGLFYGLLAVLSATAVGVLSRGESSLNVQFAGTVVIAAVLYLGLGLTIATRCRSVASAGLATAVYLGFSGLLYAVAAQVSGDSGGWLPKVASAEGAIFALLAEWRGDEAAVNGVVGFVGLVMWSLVWVICGVISLRRVMGRDA